MPANYSGFKNNIQNYLENQSAGSESDAAQYFADECMGILTSVVPTLRVTNGVLPVNSSAIQGAFLSAFNSIKSSGNNTLANWTPVATAWSNAVTGTAPIWVDSVSVNVWTITGAAGVSPAAALLFKAFGPPNKNASQVATDFRSAIQTAMDLSTHTVVNSTSGVTVGPTPGLS